MVSCTPSHRAREANRTMLVDLEESQVTGSLVVRPSRSSRRLVLIGGSQDTTVVAPSNVDLHPGPEVVVVSDGSSVAEDEEEHSPAVRVSMCQGGPGARCAGVAVPASVDDGISDTESMDSDPDRADVLEGSVASGDEEVEVPVGGWWRQCDRQQLLRGQDSLFLIIGIWVRLLRREVA